MSELLRQSVAVATRRVSDQSRAVLAGLLSLGSGKARMEKLEARRVLDGSIDGCDPTDLLDPVDPPADQIDLGYDPIIAQSGMPTDDLGDGTTYQTITWNGEEIQVIPGQYYVTLDTGEVSYDEEGNPSNPENYSTDFDPAVQARLDSLGLGLQMQTYYGTKSFFGVTAPEGVTPDQVKAALESLSGVVTVDPEQVYTLAGGVDHRDPIFDENGEEIMFKNSDDGSTLEDVSGPMEGINSGTTYNEVLGADGSLTAIYSSEMTEFGRISCFGTPIYASESSFVSEQLGRELNIGETVILRDNNDGTYSQVSDVPATSEGVAVYLKITRVAFDDAQYLETVAAWNELGYGEADPSIDPAVDYPAEEIDRGEYPSEYFDPATLGDIDPQILQNDAGEVPLVAVSGGLENTLAVVRSTVTSSVFASSTSVIERDEESLLSAI